MEPSSIVLIVAPIHYPIAVELGIYPVRFGIPDLAPPSDWPGGVLTHWKAPPCHGAPHLGRQTHTVRCARKSALLINWAGSADMRQTAYAAVAAVLISAATTSGFDT